MDRNNNMRHHSNNITILTNNADNMNRDDMAKIKVLTKYILLNNSPKPMTSSQILNEINKYDWGFRIDGISAGQLTKIINANRHTTFMSNIIYEKGNPGRFKITEKR